MTQVVIVGAGIGSRMKPITEKIQKCMIDVNGKPLVQHQIEEFVRQGFKDIIFCVGFKAEQVMEHFKDGEEFGGNILYSKEENITEDSQLTGTAGAVKLAEDKINDDFVVFYGDNLTTLDFNDLLKFHKEKNAYVTMVVRPRKEERISCVILLDEEKRIIFMLEKPSEEEQAKYLDDEIYKNNGIYVVNKDVLKYIEPGKKVDFMKDIFPRLMKEGKRLYAYVSEEFYREVGRMEKYVELQKEIKNKDLFSK